MHISLISKIAVVTALIEFDLRVIHTGTVISIKITRSYLIRPYFPVQLPYIRQFSFYF